MSEFSHDERKYQRMLEEAVAWEWQPKEDGGRTFVLTQRYRLHAFFDQMMHDREMGYSLGALAVQKLLTDKKPERAVRSHWLTKLATALHDSIGDPVWGITETGVAWFGHFYKQLVKTNPKLFVEWTEDMNTDDPENGFEKQSTALIRGVLFAPAVDQRICVKFWELAAKSEKFPLRIFSDPCPARDGCIFSSYQQRVISDIFETVSEDEVRKFAAYMFDNAWQRMVGEFTLGVQTDTIAPVGAEERNGVFDCIANNIMDVPRRRLVAELLGFTA